MFVEKETAARSAPEEQVTWLGSPPKSWQFFKLKYLLSEKPTVKGGSWPPGAISFGEVIRKEMLNAETLESYQEVRVGDILVNPINLNYDLKSLRVALSTIDVRVSPAYIVLKPNDDVNPHYLRWLLYLFDVAHMKTLGAGVRQTITFTEIGECAVCVPPTADQERIANFLDNKTARIDALIAEKERLAESLKDIEEVTAFDMVTRGLGSNANKASFVEPWLGEVPLHWGLAKIRNIAIVGNGSTPKRDNEDYWTEGATPWLNSGSVNSPRIVDASDYVTPLAIKECHLPTVRAGSTVVALTGQGKTRGRAAFAEFETTINQHLAYISVVGQKVSDEYLWVALTGFYSVFRYISDGEGSTKGALTCEELNKFRLPIPPPEEQAQIVTEYLQRIKSIDTLKEHNELHLARLREYRSSLISAAVTGLLEMKNFKEVN